jgi:hypothetical protein
MWRSSGTATSWIRQGNDVGYSGFRQVLQAPGRRFPVECGVGVEGYAPTAGPAAAPDHADRYSSCHIYPIAYI